MQNLRILLAVVVLLSVSACREDEDERLDVGYSDGYAVGYNTTCKIRETLIEGDWNSEAYTRGYNAGYAAGAADCQAADR